MSLLQRLAKEKTLTNEVPIITAQQQQIVSSQSGVADLKQKIQQQLIEKLDKEFHGKLLPEGDELQKIIEELVNSFCNDGEFFIPRPDRQKLTKQLIDEMIGFGPITPLLMDEEVSEVMVNGPQQVWVERRGRLERTEVKFQDDQHVLHVIEKIVSPLGRRIDEASPMVDARLPDGSRVNAIIPPLAINGPTITIRKFAKDPLTIDDLIKFGTLTPQIAMFLRACVQARLNVVVSGGTGSGKTTTLNVLSSFIPTDERIVTIEDAAELQLRQEHVVTLEARPANVEGKGQISIRDLVKNSLRMRPDRIIVGEVRGGEALDMLQAMNTGHDGSLTTAHANTPRDLLARLETMVLMAGMDLPVRAIREQTAAAVDLIVQQSRLKDGSRRVTHISEVQGMEGDVITLQDIFIYEQRGKDEKGKIIGQFRATGIRPKFWEKLTSSGINLPNDIFAVRD